MEDGDVEPLRPDDAQAAVRVAQHQHRVGVRLHHQLVAPGDDVAHGLTKVPAHGIHVDVGVRQAEVLEEYPVEVVVVVLPRVRQQAVEVFPAFVDHRRQPDDLRPRAHDDEQFQFPVVLELCHSVSSPILRWGFR